MHSCIYEGQVRHRRYGQPSHDFRNRLFLLYLDLQELDEVFAGRWLWSSGRASIAWFRRADHFGPSEQPLDECVRDLVLQQIGFRPNGAVRLLTQLRWFGYVMNPVSFYYCWDETDTTVHAIVAEVTNTPWGERHCYVIDTRSTTDEQNLATPSEETFAGSRAVFRSMNSKQMHVSPFLPMDLSYHWRLTRPGGKLSVHIADLKDTLRVFDATLVLQRREISSSALAAMVVRYPLITFQVAAAIYWQAIKLWWKGATFHSHPQTSLAALSGSAPINQELLNEYHDHRA